MKREYKIAGFGGQGILFLGQVLAHAGMQSGLESCWIPSYGPEMRGGTANCQVVLSDRRVRSPLVYNPDVALIFNKPSLERFAPDVRPGGAIILVSDLIDTSPGRGDIAVYAVPAKGLAEAAGEPATLNMVVAGALLAVDPLLRREDVEAAIRKVTPPHRQRMVAVNLRALDQGMDWVQTHFAAAGRAQ